MNLVIVESPTKAKTISKFLGPNYKIQASFGHIRDLPKTTLGVDVENNFQPKYVVPKKAKKTVKLLKEKMKNSDVVYLATDPDREGEAIAWHLKEVLNPKKYKRISFHEITRSAIEKALNNPRDIDINLVNAQQTRRILDRLVGYKLSPFLWKNVARKLSAGRVQSVAVRLICDREKEIKNFKAQEYWTIAVILLNHNNKEIESTLIKINDKKLEKLDLKDKKEIDEIVRDLKISDYKVVDIQKREIKKNPYPPFTTSTLQQSAWQKFHFPAKFTMGLAQSLFEKGYITYHRTDSLNLSESSLREAEFFIRDHYGNNYYQGKKYKTKSKGAQEAHEAIRPISCQNTPEKIKLKLKEEAAFRLYKLIWQRFIASQMKPAILDETKIDIEGKSNRNRYTLRSSGQNLKFDGFSKIYPFNFQESTIPDLELQEKLKLNKINPSQHFTLPPARYSEATLIKTLEKDGIGRPSTYAPIISTIQKRNYVIKNKNRKFEPTEIGMIVNDLLCQHFPKIVDTKFTAQMEENLDKIAQGKEDWHKVLAKFYKPFSDNLEKKYKEVSKKDFIKEEKTDRRCPKCGAPLVIKFSRFGKFYACSNFPKCRYTEPYDKSSNSKVQK